MLKCVSRYFSRFISRPDFVSAHLKFSSEDSSLSGYRVIVNSQEANSCFVPKQLPVQSFTMTMSSRDLVHLCYPKRESRKTVLLVGSCNGLVFVMNQGYWFIWNPTTRKHQQLLNIGIHEKVCLCCHYGFGFDVYNDDYKVVALFEDKKPSSQPKNQVSYVVKVYSLKRGYWRRVPDFTSGEFVQSFGKFASGNIHWSTTERDIVSFDVEREVFGIVKQPNYGEGYNSMKLSVLGGSFCMCYAFYSHVDVWVMKDYGIKESWEKIVYVSGVDLISKPEVCSFLPNGDLLLANGCLTVSRPKDNSHHSTGIRYFSAPISYVESLVTPGCN